MSFRTALFFGAVIACALASTPQHGSCSDGNPFSKYHYNIPVTASCQGNNKLTCTSSSPYSSNVDWGGGYIILIAVQITDTVYEPALGTVVYPGDDEKEAHFALYDSARNIIESWHPVYPEEEEVQYYIFPFTKVKSLAPGQYWVGLKTYDEGLRAPATVRNCENYYQSWSSSSFPATVDQGTSETSNSPQFGILGYEKQQPPVHKGCNCTMEIWFNNQNCTNPGNGTEKMIFAGSCDHVSLPGKEELSIATAHDCSAFAVYHGRECFGSTSPQFPNRCFNDKHSKGSYLVSCPPTDIKQAQQQKRAHRLTP